MAELMVGRELEMLYPNKRPPAVGEPILSVGDLSVDHGQEKVSFNVKPGEVLGFGGMIGAGRTELMEGLMGLRPSHAALVTLNGKGVGNSTFRTLMDLGLVYQLGRAACREGAGPYGYI